VVGRLRGLGAPRVICVRGRGANAAWGRTGIGRPGCGRPKGSLRISSIRRRGRS
jgi:hypothetical protein